MKEEEHQQTEARATEDWRKSVDRARKGRALGRALRKGKTSSLYSWAKGVRRAK